MRKTRQNISISLVVFLLLCAPIHAQSDAFKWTHIDVDIDVQKNGDLLISERQEYSFESGPGEKQHQCSRPFLMDRIDDIRDVEVYELAGNGETSSDSAPLPYTIETDQNDLRICWSCELNPPETRTFLLKYRIVGTIYVGKYEGVRRRRYRSRRGPRRSSWDELYWNAVMWPRPAVVEKASVTVHLPSKLRGKNRRIASHGSSAGIQRDTDPDTIGFSSIHPIPPEKGLQIYVAFQHGILRIKRPDWQPHKSLWQRRPPNSVMLIIVVFAAIGVVVDFFRRRCPYCGKMWGLRYTGERENLNAGKIYWFLRDDIWLYKCKACDYKEWKRRGSRGC